MEKCVSPVNFQNRLKYWGVLPIVTHFKWQKVALFYAKVVSTGLAKHFHPRGAVCDLTNLFLKTGR